MGGELLLRSLPTHCQEQTRNILNVSNQTHLNTTLNGGQIFILAKSALLWNLIVEQMSTSPQTHSQKGTIALIVQIGRVRPCFLANPH